MPHVINTALPALTALSLLIAGITPAHSEVLWYGGDISPSSAIINNTRLTDAYGSNVLDDFVVTDAAGWRVTGLFSNNVASYPIEMAPFTKAVWSIRTGVANGEFGNFLFSGISPVTVTPTGRAWGQGLEYTVAVNDLFLDLSPGSYFMSVSPIAPDQFYYVGNSDGKNAVGTSGSTGILREDHFIVNDAPDNYIGEYIYPRASMGVLGSVKQENVAVPEPSPFSLLGMALVGIFFLQNCKGVAQRKQIKHQEHC